MKKIIVAILCALMVTAGCVNHNQQGPGVEHGLGAAFEGLAHLVLSPIQIAAGLMEGIAALPYFLSTNIHEINRGLIDAQASISLDDTYDSAYGKRLAQVPDDGDTGEVFRRMKHATYYFQKVLKSYGVHDWDRYILTSIDTATDKGYTLFAVVHRPVDQITVVDKYDSSLIRTFNKSARLFYEPYERDIDGNPLDIIIDYAGLPRNDVQNQKAQAILITMAANAVVQGKRSPDYWQAEKDWIAGDYLRITETGFNRVKNRLGIK